MNSHGYYRFPAIRDGIVVFTSEDDLWTVSLANSTARRLTSGLGLASRPAISPDGKWIAFSGGDEGPMEVYLMPSVGGRSRRLSFTGSDCRVVGWTHDSKILFSSNFAQFERSMTHLYTISIDGGLPEQVPVGPAVRISYGPAGSRVIGRKAQKEPSIWKRYRGGTAGDIWIDEKGTGNFRKLIQLAGNLAYPMWIGSRVFFLSDHEGVGNIYSCLPGGDDLKRHTHHEDFYVRQPSTDGQQIIYNCGADLYVLDLSTGRSQKVVIEYFSPRTQTQRKFICAPDYLEDYAPHPEGHLLAITSRGKAFTFGNWEGPVHQVGEGDGVRYRLLRWLPDGKRLVGISDFGGEERIEIFTAGALGASEALDGIEIGNVTDLMVSPVSDEILLTNHRSELIFVDLKTKKSRLIDKSHFGVIGGFDWSPDGAWLAYGLRVTSQTSILKLHELATNITTPITKPVLSDGFPAFDPEGKYLYFLSHRFLDPVYDNIHFELGFPKTMRPCLITLQESTPSPFMPVPKPLEEKAEPIASTTEKSKEGDGDKKEMPPKIIVDFEGIEERVEAFPLPDGIYHQIEAIKGKVLFSSSPVQGSLATNWFKNEPAAKATIEIFDFSTQKAEVFTDGVTNFKIAADRKTVVLRSGNKLRVVKAGEKLDESQAKEAPSRKSGWIDLARVKVSILPLLEWRQMYREAWRLQRDHFWTEDMSKIDWNGVYKTYLPLLDRASTRAEYADIVWEMQGELGTSHAYEFGGDYRPGPRYEMGYLGADIVFDAEIGKYRIQHIVQGDSWDAEKCSPLARSSLKIQEGDTLLGIGNRALSPELSPQMMLVHQAGAEVAITVGDAEGKNPRNLSVRTLRNEEPLRYREWVEKNRSYVHSRTKGKVGYVHVPDMGPRGFSEFHRYYLAECNREGLVVDVRFNGGGHVSALLLEKLARKRIGYMQSRWFGTEPFPGDSVGGPLVALTNEYAGSDGDIFSHSFKLMKLGPLIGTRTWGGVIGIWPRRFFVDGSLTTQPEFSFWFKDVGWAVENYGTEPDIEVDIRPQDYLAKRDPQLDRGIEEILMLIERDPPLRADLDRRPDLRPPKLPKHEL